MNQSLTSQIPASAVVASIVSNESAPFIPQPLAVVEASDSLAAAEKQLRQEEEALRLAADALERKRQAADAARVKADDEVR